MMKKGDKGIKKERGDREKKATIRGMLL